MCCCPQGPPGRCLAAAARWHPLRALPASRLRSSSAPLCCGRPSWPPSARGPASAWPTCKLDGKTQLSFKPAFAAFCTHALAPPPAPTHPSNCCSTAASPAGAPLLAPIPAALTGAVAEAVTSALVGSAAAARSLACSSVPRCCRSWSRRERASGSSDSCAASSCTRGVRYSSESTHEYGNANCRSPAVTHPRAVQTLSGASFRTSSNSRSRR